MHAFRDAAARLTVSRLFTRQPVMWARTLALIASIFVVLSGGCGISAPAYAGEMRFNLVSIGNAQYCGAQCPDVITANGEITDNTPYNFLNFVHDNIGHRDLHSVILLDSPGGKVVAAMELGRIWRRLGATAVVARPELGRRSRFLAASCESACVYALIGARRRVVPPGSIVGVHRMFFYDDDSGPMNEGSPGRRHYDNGSMKAMLSRYTARMGVSPALISEAERISSDHIHILSRAEMARYHLASSKF